MTMVDYSIKIHPKQRQAYIPKTIVESVGYRLKARPNHFAVILYPDGIDMNLVVQSVENLLKEMRVGIKESDGHVLDQEEK